MASNSSSPPLNPSPRPPASFARSMVMVRGPEDPTAREPPDTVRISTVVILSGNYTRTFSGRWNISTSADSFSARRFDPFLYDAPMNVLNKGCGSSGFDLNSGWNWHPMKCGWFGNSTISTYVPSGVEPEILRPAAV